MRDDPDITELLQLWSAGEPHARDAVFERMYAQLKRVAVNALRAEHGQVTFEPTALLNDALARLLEGSVPRLQDRKHFVGIVARVIRQVMVDRSRRRMSDKRGAGERPLSLDAVHDLPHVAPSELLHFDRVLDELAELDPQAAEVVQLRVFTGLTINEAAQVLAISPSAVNREWAHARAWLRDRLEAQL